MFAISLIRITCQPHVAILSNNICIQGGQRVWLFLINGGQAVFIKLSSAKNRLNGSNTDVPRKFYFRFDGCCSPARATPARYTCLGLSVAVPTLPVLPTLDGSVQGELPAHAQAHPPGQSADACAPERTKYPCTSCNRYFRHRFVGIRPCLHATESYRLEVFEAHDGGVSQRKLSTTHRIGSTPSSAGISCALNQGCRSFRAEAAHMRQTEFRAAEKLVLLSLYACLSKNLSLPRRDSPDTYPRRLMFGTKL